MKKRFLVAIALLGTLGVAGIARSFTGNQPQRTVAVVAQPQVTATAASSQRKELSATANDPLNDTDAEVQDNQVPQALSNVGEYGEQVYDMAKIGDWAKAQADLTTLQQAVQQLSQQSPSNNSHLLSLGNSVARLSQAVEAKDQQATQHYANQVTLIAAQMTQLYQTKVPIEVTLLDYYGRQLEVDAASGNMAQLQSTASQIEQTWSALRPVIMSHGGSAEVQQFDGLVARVKQAKSVADYSQLATPILDQVDQLEAVFK